ncbi:MAG: hypothetical protein MR303_10085 [Emergencia sp.]|nr:hypothetical protein [Emergencia sp.]
MKREFGIKKYGHVLLIMYVPVYLIGFFLMERWVPETADYWVSYCFLDDLIPFNEWFIIPYCLWYPLLFAAGFWLLLRDVQGFKLYMYCMIVGFTASIIFCLIFPNGQDLRPEVFPRENLLTDMVALIYAADTNTNVLPSVHAEGAIFAAMGICTTKSVKSMLVKVAAVVIAGVICMSTCFVKQHSALDVAAAVVLCLIIYSIVRINMKNELRIS